MIGHLLGAAGAVEAVATIQVFFKIIISTGKNNYFQEFFVLQH